MTARWAGLVAAAAALGSLAGIALAGGVQADLYGTPFERFAYGFFLDRWPLFLGAVVYGAVFILARVFTGRASLPRRVLRLAGGVVGAGLFLAICLFPTFGGFVLRPAFMVGGMSFLSSAPLAVAVAAGAAAAALPYALALGLGGLLADPRLRLSWRAAGRAAASLAALFLGALALAAPRALGWDLGGWPRLPLTGSSAGVALAVTALALAPHALLQITSRSSR